MILSELCILKQTRTGVNVAQHMCKLKKKYLDWFIVLDICWSFVQ